MEEHKTFYAIKHNVTGNVYVGSTLHPIRYRIQSHMKALRKHQHKQHLMQEDFDRYGADYSVFILNSKEYKRASNEEAFWMMYFGSDRQYNQRDRLAKRKPIDEFPHDTDAEEFIKNLFDGSHNSYRHIDSPGSYKRYREFADSNGVKDADVCKAVGISAAQISAWKHNMYEPKLKSLLKIAAFLNVKVDDLIGEIED